MSAHLNAAAMPAVLPNFMVIGAPKCGTTTLCDQLGSHPDVFMSDPKEPHYFGRTDPALTWDRYLALFARARNERAIGEGSTSYTRPDINRAAAEAIKSVMPDGKLIYMVRDPVRRLESDWRMRVHEGWRSESINSAVRNAIAHGDRPLVPREVDAELRWQRLLLTQGAYWSNLSEYRRLFTDDQILVVFLEDFSRSPQSELARCFEHLGVDPRAVPTEVRALNRGEDHRRDGTIARFVRERLPFQQLRAMTPEWAVRMAKSVLTTAAVARVEWDPRVRREAAEWFSDDSRRFLEFYGKPADFWK